MDLIKFVPQSKEEALGMLAEFIEDCEYTKLGEQESFFPRRPRCQWA
jgi:hypothetical protein